MSEFPRRMEVPTFFYVIGGFIAGSLLGITFRLSEILRAIERLAK
jgi:hypothetical protein